jgi:hypothetical protein
VTDAAIPTISVVIACREPWPALERALTAVHDQVADVGGELVVAIATTDAAPIDAAERHPHARFVVVPGGSVFRLRAAALARCRAPIVAITEDHAYVAPDWCRRVLEAHAEHPEAAAIGGVVENGATRSLKDRVGFFIANGPFMPPVEAGAHAAISQQANVSYKRDVLPRVMPPLGFMVHTFHEELRRRGAVLLADDRLVAFHVQELSLAGHAAGHFHNGRSIAAFRAAHLAAWWRPIRALGCFVLPPVMLARTLRALVAKGQDPALLARGLPVMIGLLCCHAAGELLGWVAGPGTSPEHVD